MGRIKESQREEKRKKNWFSWGAVVCGAPGISAILANLVSTHFLPTSLPRPHSVVLWEDFLKKLEEWGMLFGLPLGVVGIVLCVFAFRKAEPRKWVGLMVAVAGATCGVPYWLLMALLWLMGGWPGG